MHGVIAAGSGPTAEAGAEVLRAGGNAVDAAVAACCATAAGEPTLTSLAGGGVMLVREAASGEVTACDFFANAPGLGGQTPTDLDFFAVDLDFGPAKQRFHIGAAAAAVPGVIPGLCEALERWGRLPLRDVVRPACRLLREGIVLGPWQARAARLLEPIMLHTAAGRELFGVDGRLIDTGDRFAIPSLADTLEQLADQGWRTYNREVIERAMLDQFGVARGGLLSRADFEAYRVEFRRPLRARYRGYELLSNPPPAMGGRMVALMLGLLEQRSIASLHPSERPLVELLAHIMWVADEARAAGEDAILAAQLPRWLERLAELERSPLGVVEPVPAGPPSTTHVSVLDAAGNAATVTFSFGEGNGHLIGDTGVMMNNLMGEEDLFPGGFHSWPAGQRLSTMMAPTIAVSPEGDLIAMGSGGANRIRTAMTQVISYLLDRRDAVGHAVKAPRVHYEAGVLNVETYEMPPGTDDSWLDTLGASMVVRFDEPNLFFGGVHLVRRTPQGELQGAGDPRRGGVCLVV